MIEVIIFIIMLIITWGVIWVDYYTHSLTDRKHCQHCDKHFCTQQHEKQQKKNPKTDVLK